MLCALLLNASSFSLKKNQVPFIHLGFIDNSCFLCTVLVLLREDDACRFQQRFELYYYIDSCMSGGLSIEKVSHCPECQKPLISGGQFTGSAEFNMRCPWCQATVEVSIQPRINVRAIKAGQPRFASASPQQPYAAFQKKAGEEIGSIGLEFDAAENPTSKDKGMKIVGYIYPHDSDDD